MTMLPPIAQAPPFEQVTRRYTVPLDSKTKGTSNPLKWTLDKAGILQGIMLQITGSNAGTLSALNAFGKSSIVKRVYARANTGLELFSFSGPDYHWAIRDFIETYEDPVSFSDGRSAVATGAFDISMWLPIALNLRDHMGMIMLQNEATNIVLEVEFEADATVATGATVTATVRPHMVVFDVPQDPRSWPQFNTIQTMLAEEQVISGAGDFTHTWLRGNAYAGLYYAMGHGVSGADAISKMEIKAVTNQKIDEYVPGTLDILFGVTHGRARPKGIYPLDLMGTSGLWNYGTIRDVIYSQNLTNLKTILTFTGAGTLRIIRRELVTLRAQ